MNALLKLSLPIALPLSAQAHPGHAPDDGWLHWLAAEHLLPALVVLAAIAYALKRWQARS